MHMYIYIYIYLMSPYMEPQMNRFTSRPFSWDIASHCYLVRGFNFNVSSGATCCHKTATPSSKLAKKTPVPIVVSTINHSQPSYKPYLKPYSYWSYKPITWIPTIRLSAFPDSNTDSTTVRPTMQSHCTRRSSCSLFAQTWDLKLGNPLPPATNTIL